MRSAACITLGVDAELPEGFEWREIDGGMYAVYHVIVRDDEFAAAWHKMREWLGSNGAWRHTGGPTYEVYLNNAMNDPEGKWRLNLCVPVESTANDSSA